MSRRTSRSSRSRTSRMHANVLLLPNPKGKPRSPAYETTLREALRKANAELYELQMSGASGLELLQAEAKVENLDRKLRVAAYDDAQYRSKAYREYLKSSRAAQGLPSAEFKKWSMKPNVLLLANPGDESSMEETLRMSFFYTASTLDRTLTSYRRTGEVGRLAQAVFLLGGLRQLETSYHEVPGSTARSREGITEYYNRLADRLFGEMNKVGWNWRYLERGYQG